MTRTKQALLGVTAAIALSAAGFAFAQETPRLPAQRAPDQAPAGQSTQGQAIQEQGGAQGGTGQAGPGQAGPGQGGPGQRGPGPGQGRVGEGGPGQGGPGMMGRNEGRGQEHHEGHWREHHEGMRFGGMGGPMMRICEGNAEFSKPMLDRLEQSIQIKDAQKTDMDALRTAATKAEQTLKAACPTEAERTDRTPPARMALAEKHATAMAEALRTVRPPFEALYAKLDDKQRDRMRWGGMMGGMGGGMGGGRGERH